MSHRLLEYYVAERKSRAKITETGNHVSQVNHRPWSHPREEIRNISGLCHPIFLPPYLLIRHPILIFHHGPSTKHLLPLPLSRLFPKDELKGCPIPTLYRQKNNNIRRKRKDSPELHFLAIWGGSSLPCSP